LLPEAVHALLRARAPDGLSAADLHLKFEGSLRVAFEETQFRAAFTAVSRQLDELRSQVRSVVPPGTPSPGLLLHVPADAGEARQETTLESALLRQVQVRIDSRKGARIDKESLRHLTDTLLSYLVEQQRLDGLKAEERVCVLLGDRVTLSATLGEVRELAGKKREERENTLKQAQEDKRKRTEDSAWKGRVSVSMGGWVVVPPGVAGASDKVDAEVERRLKKEEEESQKRDLETAQKGLDALDHLWKGRQPTLSALRLEGKTVAESVRASGFEITRSVSAVGWMDYTWPEVRLSAGVPPYH
jgi:hypothetical protein